MKATMIAALGAAFLILIPTAGQARHDFQSSAGPATPQIKAATAKGRSAHRHRHKHRSKKITARKGSYPAQRPIQSAVVYHPLDPYEFGAFIDIPPDILEMLPKSIINDVLVIQAKAYLVKTAIPGGTMMTYGRRIAGKGASLARIKQAGAEYAIGMLHNVYAIRLARAVRQARAEGLNIGVFSAYRGPDLGVGGFGDKTESTHAAGIGSDMYGIKSAAIAARWQKIANANGLYLPYGPHNRAERNHTQLLMIASTKERPALKKMITVYRKKPMPVVIRRELWAASGVAPDKLEPASVRQVSYIGGRRAAKKRYAIRPKAYHRRLAAS